MIDVNRSANYMTIRTRVAMAAMEGLLARGFISAKVEANGTPEYKLGLYGAAVAHADGLLSELEKTHDPTR